MLDPQDQATLPAARPAPHDARTLIRAEGLCKTYAGRPVLESVSFDLRRGDVVLLRGRNGSGKTTLLDLLSGHLRPDGGTIQYAIGQSPLTFTFPRPFWQGAGLRRSFAPEIIARTGLGRTWQEPRLFDTLTLRDNIAVANREQFGEAPLRALLRRWRSRSAERHVFTAAEVMLARLGLEGRGHSSADMVSFGQAKILEVGRALETQAAVLCLDEPFAGLDPSRTADMLVVLSAFLRESSITLVIAEHASNASAVLALATKVWSLADGRLRIERPEDIEPRSSNTPSYMRLEGPGDRLVDAPLPGGAVLSRITADQPDKTVVLDVHDLVVRSGRRVIVGEETGSGAWKGINLTLRENERVVLHAPNGWGKTTLLRALAGIRPITNGSVTLDGRDMRALSAWQRSNAGISLVQAQSTSFGALTVAETFRLTGLAAIPPFFQHLLRCRVADLSTGERQILSLHCGLAKPSRVTLLDEPFLGLDAHARAEVEKLISQQPGVILISGPYD